MVQEQEKGIRVVEVVKIQKVGERVNSVPKWKRAIRFVLKIVVAGFLLAYILNILIKGA